MDNVLNVMAAISSKIINVYTQLCLILIVRDMRVLIVLNAEEVFTYQTIAA